MQRNPYITQNWANEQYWGRRTLENEKENIDTRYAVGFTRHIKILSKFFQCALKALLTRILGGSLKPAYQTNAGVMFWLFRLWHFLLGYKKISAFCLQQSRKQVLDFGILFMNWINGIIKQKQTIQGKDSLEIPYNLVYV